MTEAHTDGVVVELAPGDDAPRVARRFIDEHAMSLPPGLKQDAQLLVSEVVTNAVVHGQPTITLRVSLDPPGIGVAVHDAGEGMPSASPSRPEPGSASGRGLLIVEALASTWGIIPSDPPPGKTVWFRLTPQGD